MERTGYTVHGNVAFQMQLTSKEHDNIFPFMYKYGTDPQRFLI